MQHWGSLKSVLIDHLDTKRVEFSDHARLRMDERKVPRDVVRSILRHGAPTEMYNSYEYPHGPTPRSNKDPVFTFLGVHEGEKIAIGLALRLIVKRGISAEFRIVTVITELEHSRHNKS